MAWYWGKAISCKWPHFNEPQVHFQRVAEVKIKIHQGRRIDVNKIIIPSWCCTFAGFRAVGFNPLISFLAMVIINGAFSYNTQDVSIGGNFWMQSFDAWSMHMIHSACRCLSLYLPRIVAFWILVVVGVLIDYSPVMCSLGSHLLCFQS
jgi:hypothetical protein